eukprot:2791606-Ditylum_brightwellii.AAC.1
MQKTDVLTLQESMNHTEIVKAMAESVQQGLAVNDERKATETAPQIAELQSQLTKMCTLLSSMQQ